MPTPVMLRELKVYYPDSDGLPMAESDFQREPLTYAVESLRMYFRDRSDVYVSGNMFIYFEEGKPSSVVAPDVFVVMGAPNHDRRSYMLWKEPKAPDFVMEITSESTHSEDQGTKRGIYAFLGVREYWQYDPTGDYLKPPLRGLYLEGENYVPLPAHSLIEGGIVMRSEVLGLDLRLEKGGLRFYDPATNERLLSYEEAELKRREEVQARQQAEQALQQTQQALQQTEQALQQTEQALQQTEQARQQAEQLRLQAEAEARREAVARQAAEARLAELEAALRKLQK